MDKHDMPPSPGDRLLITEHNIVVDPDLIENDDYINAYIKTWFDVDERFGTDTADNDNEYVIFFADYYYGEDRLDAYYVIHEIDGVDQEPVSVDLASSEREAILSGMYGVGLGEILEEIEEYGHQGQICPE